MKPTVREMTEADWPAVRAIYEEGISTGNATFEVAAPDWQQWDAAHRADCRLVVTDGGAVGGWVALSPYSSREVYRGVAELGIYVGAAFRGRGLGRTCCRH